VRAGLSPGPCWPAGWSVQPAARLAGVRKAYALPDRPHRGPRPVLLRARQLSGSAEEPDCGGSHQRTGGRLRRWAHARAAAAGAASRSVLRAASWPPMERCGGFVGHADQLPCLGPVRSRGFCSTCTTARCAAARLSTCRLITAQVSGDQARRIRRASRQQRFLSPPTPLCWPTSRFDRSLFSPQKRSGSTRLDLIGGVSRSARRARNQEPISNHVSEGPSEP